MPADRGDRASSTLHSTLWSHETCWADRSANWTSTICRGAVAAGEPARGFIQPGRFSKPFEIGRAGSRIAIDSGVGKRALSALRADSPQYIYQLTHTAARYFADERAQASVFCGADLRRGRLC